MVEDVYFEWVPARFVDVHVTEKGVLDGKLIQDISWEKERLENEFFEDDTLVRATE